MQLSELFNFNIALLPVQKALQYKKVQKSRTADFLTLPGSKCSFLVGHLSRFWLQTHTREKMGFPPSNYYTCGHLYTLWVIINRRERMAYGWLMSSDAGNAPFRLGRTVWKVGKLPKKVFTWHVNVVNSSKRSPWLAVGVWVGNLGMGSTVNMAFLWEAIFFGLGLGSDYSHLTSTGAWCGTPRLDFLSVHDSSHAVRWAGKEALLTSSLLCYLAAITGFTWMGRKKSTQESTIC